MRNKVVGLVFLLLLMGCGNGQKLRDAEEAIKAKEAQIAQLEEEAKFRTEFVDSYTQMALKAMAILDESGDAYTEGSALLNEGGGAEGKPLDLAAAIEADRAKLNQQIEALKAAKAKLSEALKARENQQKTEADRSKTTIQVLLDTIDQLEQRTIAQEEEIGLLIEELKNKDTQIENLEGAMKKLGKCYVLAANKSILDAMKKDGLLRYRFHPIRRWTHEPTAKAIADPKAAGFQECDCNSTTLNYDTTDGFPVRIRSAHKEILKDKELKGQNDGAITIRKPSVFWAKSPFCVIELK